MASIVQVAAASGNSLAFPGAVTPGNALICAHNGQGTDAGVTCADTVNGAWQEAVVLNSGGLWAGIFYFAATGAGTPTVVISDTGLGTQRIQIYEVSGLAASPLILANSSDNGAGTSHPCGNVTIPRPGFFVYVATPSGNPGTTTPPSGFTERATGSASVRGDFVDPTGSTQTGTWGSANNVSSVGCLAGFADPDAGGGGGTAALLHMTRIAHLLG